MLSFVHFGDPTQSPLYLEYGVNFLPLDGTHRLGKLKSGEVVGHLLHERPLLAALLPPGAKGPTSNLSFLRCKPLLTAGAW